MKTIVLPKGQSYPALAVLKSVMANGDTGLTIADVRKRMRVIDVLEACSEEAEIVNLEDADFETLRSVFQRAKFAVAHRDIIEVGDALDAAASP